MIRRACVAGLLAMLAACAGRGPAPDRASPAVVAASPVLSTEGWEFAGHRGALIRTHSYRLFTTAADPSLVAEMPGFLERALEQYTTALGPLPRPQLKLDTFLMGDRSQWEALTRRVMGADAATYLRIERGGFASGGRALLWTIGRHDTLAIAAHEGWHQFTQRTFRDELPAWMEEGAAVLMEGFVPDPINPANPIFLAWANPERFDQLARTAQRHELVPLEALLTQNPQTLISASTDATLTYYAQLWGLMQFFREGESGKYRDRVRSLVSDAAAGRMNATIAARLGRPARRTDDAFRVYIGSDLDGIGAEYEAFLIELVQAGNREKIVSGRSPVGVKP